MATCSLHQKDRLDVEFLKSEGIVFKEKETYREAGKQVARTPSLLTCMGCIYAHREKPFCIEGYEISSDTGVNGYMVHPPGGRGQMVVLWTEHQCGSFPGQTSLRFLKGSGEVLLSYGFVLGRSPDILCALQIGPTFKELYKRTLLAHQDTAAWERVKKRESYFRRNMRAKDVDSTAGQTPHSHLYEDDDEFDEALQPISVENQRGEGSHTLPNAGGSRKDSTVHHDSVDESHPNNIETEAEVGQSPHTAVAPGSTSIPSSDPTSGTHAPQEPVPVSNVDFSAATRTWTMEKARKDYPDLAKTNDEATAEEVELMEWIHENEKGSRLKSWKEISS